MAEADVVDKERAKRKRQEKRRRAKEIERQLAEADGTRAPAAEFAGGDWDSDDLPDLVLPGDEEAADEDAASDGADDVRETKRARTSSLAEQEAQALALLGD